MTKNISKSSLLFAKLHVDQGQHRAFLAVLNNHVCLPGFLVWKSPQRGHSYSKFALHCNALLALWNILRASLAVVVHGLLNQLFRKSFPPEPLPGELHGGP